MGAGICVWMVSWRKKVPECLLRVCLTFLWAALAAGCAFTGFTKDIGVRRNSLTLDRVQVLPGSGVLIEARLVQTRSCFNPISAPAGQEYRRYVLADSQAVAAALATADVVTLAGGNVRHVVSPRVSADGQDGWQMIPAHTRPVAAVEVDLPVPAGQMPWYPRGNDIPVPSADGEKRLFIHELRFPRELGEEVRWWHYPAQILLVPAAALDVVTFPFQFYWVLWQVDRQTK